MNKYFHIDEEAARCLLCADAPCSKACGKGDVARAIQAVRFGNEKNAARWVKDCTASDLAAAQEEGQVFGGLQAGDRMAVVPNADKTEALMVINETTLMGNWVMLNPLDGSDEVGIRIKEGGIAEGIEQSTISYRTWRLTRGQLEIVQVEEEGSGQEETYVYDIVKLGADSLIYKDDEDTYEYARQRAKKPQKDEIKLEDSSTEEFRI